MSRHRSRTRVRAALLAATFLAVGAVPMRAQPTSAADSAARAAERAEDAVAATRFYAATTPLEVTFTADLAQLRRDRRDGAPWRSATLGYDAANGERVVLPIRARTRGIWRLRNCHFPPLRLDLPRGAGRATEFRGLNQPKLVTHCRDENRAEEYVLQEFQLYRIYALLTPISHRVRLLRVTYVDSASGRTDAVRHAIMLEEPDALAARNAGHVLDIKGVTPDDLDPATSTLAAVFQYMIGNTDWSIGALHNAELVATQGALLHPVPYDFDHAGAVDAFYAHPPPQLNLRSVRDRLYRGFCVPDEEFARTFAHVLSKRDAIRALYTDELGQLLQRRTVERTLAYFDEFFRTIEDPARARRHIVAECRGPNGE